MRYGIPGYTDCQGTLDKEIDIVRSLGVKIMTGKALARTSALKTCTMTLMPSTWHRFLASHPDVDRR